MKRRSFAEPHSSLGLFAQHHASTNSPSSANGATGGAVQQWISVADGANKPRRSPGRTARRFSAFVGTNIGLAARRGSAMPVLQHEPEFEASTKSQQVLGLRNEEWNRVQSKVLSVFNKRRLQPGELYELNKLVKVAIKSEIGSFISEYYKKNLLQRGMKSLYDSLDNDGGQGLLSSLAELWNYFFTEILPTLRAIFYPVQTKGHTMYQLSLLGFRDHVVLQLPLKKALSSCNESEIPPEITQMLLNLHAVHDGGTYATTPSEEYVQLEAILAKVVCPFLGSKGLYLRMGEDDPAVPARDPNAKEDGQGTPGSNSSGTQGRKYETYPKSRVCLKVININSLD
ncbi:proline-rich protein 5-like isoform X3 [Strongylocentrotus purpuratus]|uniref:Proline-rich protein 5 n=1 Tax=Strongylocentrotus purpuratus TaxID=7668 RepID=A0A7M7P8X3_STRPU|nr:proline-rich protein 5-like isoform X3 [Strongylocentrotus purpuratus]